MKIRFVTNNEHKLREVQSFLTHVEIVAARFKIEEIQTNLLWCNITALIVEKQIYKKAKDTNKITIYQTLIPAKNPNLKGAHLKHTEIKTQHYEGKIYCVRVSTSYIVCRRNGKIFVTGNSINARKLDISRDSAKSFSYA